VLVVLVALVPLAPPAKRRPFRTIRRVLTASDAAQFARLRYNPQLDSHKTTLFRSSSAAPPVPLTDLSASGSHQHQPPVRALARFWLRPVRSSLGERLLEHLFVSRPGFAPSKQGKGTFPNRAKTVAYCDCLSRRTPHENYANQKH
jgi:hypothetical protein